MRENKIHKHAFWCELSLITLNSLVLHEIPNPVNQWRRSKIIDIQTYYIFTLEIPEFFNWIKTYLHRLLLIRIKNSNILINKKNSRLIQRTKLTFKTTNITSLINKQQYDWLYSDYIVFTPYRQYFGHIKANNCKQTTVNKYTCFQ